MYVMHLEKYSLHVLCFVSITLLTDQKDIAAMNKYFDEVTDRWKKMKVEISSVETSLQETIQYWTRYTACRDLFHVWLNDAEQMLQKPPEEIGVRLFWLVVNAKLIFL